MLCLGCGVWADGTLCWRCRIGLRSAPERVIGGVGVVRVGYLHEGVARTLVHQLKYRGILAASRLLAEGIDARLGREDAVLVPVPRVGWRRLRYGVDPALELARSVSVRSGFPVSAALTAAFWGRARAGKAHDSVPRFSHRADADTRQVRERPVILVDDVITTGATLAAAAAVAGEVIGAVTATGSVGSPLQRRFDPAIFGGR